MLVGEAEGRISGTGYIAREFLIVPSGVESRGNVLLSGIRVLQRPVAQVQAFPQPVLNASAHTLALQKTTIARLTAELGNQTHGVLPSPPLVGRSS